MATVESAGERSGGAARTRPRSVPVSVAVWLAAAGLAVFALLRAAGLERGYPLVPVLAFTPYVLAASVVPLVAAAVLRRWAALAATAVAVVVLAVAVVPRAVPFGITGAGGPELRILTVNVLGGGADPAAVMAAVREREVDVLALQESTPDMLARLFAQGLDDLLPHAVDHSAPSVEGTSVHSVHPLTDLGDAGEGVSAFAMPTARVEVPGWEGVLEVTAVHPYPPIDASYTAHWRAGLRALPAAADGEALRILAGDFNATPDHAELRRVLDSGYVDAASVRGQGLAGTWPSSGPLPRVAIDHVLVDSSIGVGDVAVVPVAGTDHLGVFARVTLPEGR
ncbi:endonuclease/exonuclease/phosphatase (EEP) superfamily protein YafD [Nocardiopsis sp. Huas11]|uniref:endonuclease/exonuclease/phosphatase family protein n=1 Tax=Nocardiopsis sp. Huas11 TaxID=2183912 RepID=UPI000EAE369F|nr:endonuclease/exonuclease/phosphatase family protein [Nocardiopsis sp. Huas11]RKS05103.1 endonuclease/exonuclease/phosphatase (EEP) superfamily protein YafD [Nocardiopsis sp. Huas11]